MRFSLTFAQFTRSPFNFFLNAWNQLMTKNTIYGFITILFCTCFCVSYFDKLIFSQAIFICVEHIATWNSFPVFSERRKRMKKATKISKTSRNKKINKWRKKWMSHNLLLRSLCFRFTIFDSVILISRKSVCVWVRIILLHTLQWIVLS